MRALKACIPGILAILALAGPVRAQSVITSTAGLTIQGFSVVTSPGVPLQFEIDPATGTGIGTGGVVYETNRTDRTVRLQVDGDLSGYELRVEPLTGDLAVLGMAVTGSAGSASMISFREPGVQPIVTGVTGAGADLPLRYTLLPVESGAAPGPRTVRVTFTID